MITKEESHKGKAQQPNPEGAHPNLSTRHQSSIIVYRGSLLNATLQTNLTPHRSHQILL